MRKLDGALGPEVHLSVQWYSGQGKHESRYPVLKAGGSVKTSGTMASDVHTAGDG